MKKLILINLILFSLTLIPFKVLAQTESEPSPSPNDLIKQKVDERIEKAVSNAEEATKQAFVGEIEEIANATLTLKTTSGEEKTKVAEDATILNSDRDEIDLEDLEIGEKVIVMGYMDDQGILEARRVVVIEEFQTSESEAIFGIVTDISSEEKILTVKTKDETLYTVEMDSEVEISQTLNGDKETADFKDIKENDSLVIIGETEENAKKMITASLIHLITSEVEEEVTEEEPSE